MYAKSWRLACLGFLTSALMLGWALALLDVSMWFAVRQPYGISNAELSGSLTRELGARPEWQVYLFVPSNKSEFRDKLLTAVVDSDGPLISLIASHVDLVIKAIPPKEADDKAWLQVWEGKQFVQELEFALEQPYVAQGVAQKLSECLHDYNKKGNQNG